MAPVKSTSLIILALCVATPQGVTIRSGSEIDLSEPNPDHIVNEHDQNSRPGTPQIPGLTGNPKDWKEELGERLIAAADAHDAMQGCGSFSSFGDYTWCDKAMPEKTAYAKAAKGYHAKVYNLKNVSQESLEKSEGQFLGLSYGIQLRDPWSEFMSNMYQMDTKLYDCYFKGDQGPMANDLLAEKPCEQKMCYSTKYEANKVCLGTEKKTDHDHDGRELKYDKLSNALEDRAPLSTFVKMDVEGSEWPALEELLNSPEDLAKIRSLDMEVHLHQDREGKKRTAKETLEWKVGIMERLAKEFAVTGSTIDPLYRILKQEQQKTQEIPKQRNLLQKVGTFLGLDHEEAKQERIDSKNALLYATNGMPMDQYCISFVNRKLL